MTNHSTESLWINTIGIRSPFLYKQHFVSWEDMCDISQDVKLGVNGGDCVRRQEWVTYRGRAKEVPLVEQGERIYTCFSPAY